MDGDIEKSQENKKTWLLNLEGNLDLRSMKEIFLSNAVYWIAFVLTWRDGLYIFKKAIKYVTSCDTYANEALKVSVFFSAFSSYCIQAKGKLYT